MGMAPDDLLELYTNAADKLELAIAGLSEADLDLASGPGEWSIRQLLHHIVEGDFLWTTPLKIALGSPGSGCRLDWYPGNDEWGESLNYSRRAVGPAVALLRANRAHVADLLAAVPGAGERHVRLQWTPEGEPAPMTVGEIVRLQAAHAAGHIEEIRERRTKIHAS